MGVKDITAESVLAAVQAGHDDVYKLAEHFVVLHSSHTLHGALSALLEAHRLVCVNPAAPWREYRWAVAS